MPITLPATVAANELIQSSWGNAVRAALAEIDAEMVERAGDTMTGLLDIDLSSGDVPLILRGASDTPSLQWKSQSGSTLFEIIATASDVTLDSLSTNLINITAPLQVNRPSGSEALVLRASTDTPALTFKSQSGTTLLNVSGSATAAAVDATGRDITFTSDQFIVSTAATQRLLISSGGTVILGKASAGLNLAGIETTLAAASMGSLRVTTSAISIENLYCRHEGSADANGEDFAVFTRGASVIGSIDQNSTTGVNFNTTSDARLKTDIGLDAADGLDTVAQVTVRRFTQAGVEGIGMFAQELNNVIPSAVKVGGNDPEAEPWQVAYSDKEIIAHALLAIQQLAGRVTDLEAAP